MKNWVESGVLWGREDWCVLAVFILIFGRGGPEDRGYPLVNSIRNLDKMECKEKFSQMGQNFLVIFKKVDFWHCCVYSFFRDGIYFNLSGLWIGPFFKDVYNYSLSYTGLILRGFIIGSLICCFLCPKISKCLNTKKWLSVGASILGTIFVI